MSRVLIFIEWFHDLFLCYLFHHVYWPLWDFIHMKHFKVKIVGCIKSWISCVFFPRKWTLRWMRTALWTSVWRSPSNERAVCLAPAPGFAPQTLLPHPHPRSITVVAVGWHHPTYTPTSRRSGRDLWITPNPTAKGRRKWTRSVQWDWRTAAVINMQYFLWY